MLVQDVLQLTPYCSSNSTAWRSIRDRQGHRRALAPKRKPWNPISTKHANRPTRCWICCRPRNERRSESAGSDGGTVVALAGAGAGVRRRRHAGNRRGARSRSRLARSLAVKAFHMKKFGASSASTSEPADRSSAHRGGLVSGSTGRPARHRPRKRYAGSPLRGSLSDQPLR